MPAPRTEPYGGMLRVFQIGAGRPDVRADVRGDSYSGRFRDSDAFRGADRFSDGQARSGAGPG